VPQTKARSSSKSGIATATLRTRRPAASRAGELIGKMIDYESAAARTGTDLTSGRFQMMTASERDFTRAELIADYIRLSAGNLGKTPGYYDAAMIEFCAKICDMQIPSHELVGTYLAAQELAEEEDYLKALPNLDTAIRGTMLLVLETCARKLDERATPSPVLSGKH